MAFIPLKNNRIFKNKKKLFTLSHYNKSIYGEKIIPYKNKFLREWDPYRSKLSAALVKGSPELFLKQSDYVLYLGASTGTTVSHISDIVEGYIFAIEFSPSVMRELVFLAEERDNIIPVLADANHPEVYINRISKVDWLFQDIAQPNQVEIFLKNIKVFLKAGGFAVLAVKSRSIDIAKKPKDIFKEVNKQLEKYLKIVDYRTLYPYEKDHAIFFCKYV